MSMFYRGIISAAILTAAAAALGQATTAPATAAVGSAIEAAAPTTVVDSPVERATADAVARLYAAVAAERIGGMSLGEVLDRSGAKSAVMTGLADAQQIGGPRTIGDGIVQVSLEMRGDRAAKIVSDAVAREPGRSPVSPRQLATALRSWNERAFRATGDSGATSEVNASEASTGGGIHLPDVAPEWTHEAQTASAVAKDSGNQLRTARQAERAARDALRAQLVKLQLDPTQTVGQAPKPAIDAMLSAARIANVDYRADGSVQVSVSIDGQQVWQMLQLSSPR